MPLPFSGILDASRRQDAIRDLCDRKRPWGCSKQRQSFAEQRASSEPRIRLLSAPCGNRPHAVFRVEQLDDGFNVFHSFGKPFSFSLIGLYLAAQVGVKPNQIINGGMIGTSFERVGHS
jgi:hypothetical protein